MEENTRVQEIEGEITALRQLLTNSDYKALKYSEGYISETDYAETKVLRQGYRDKINELEAELATLNE